MDDGHFTPLPPLFAFVLVLAASSSSGVEKPELADLESAQKVGNTPHMLSLLSSSSQTHSILLLLIILVSQLLNESFHQLASNHAEQRLAEWSATLLLGQGNATDLSAACLIFDEAYRHGGLDSLLRLLNWKSQELALKRELTKYVSALAAAEILERQFYFPATSTGSRFWPEHLAGAFLSNKAVSEGTEMVQLVRTLQHKEMSISTINEFPVISVLHGVAYGYRVDSLDHLRYPAYAEEWCDAYGNKTIIEIPGDGPSDLRQECLHGLGHGMFHAVAAHRRTDSACNGIAPRTWTMNRDDLKYSFACLSAPTRLHCYTCCNGFFHSYFLYAKQNGTAFSYRTPYSTHVPAAMYLQRCMSDCQSMK